MSLPWLLVFHPPAPLKLVPFLVYAMGPSFVTLLEAALQLTFWNRMSGIQQLFLRFRKIHGFSFQKWQNHNRTKLMRMEGGWPQPCFQQPKFASVCTHQWATEAQRFQSSIASSGPTLKFTSMFDMRGQTSDLRNGTSSVFVNSLANLICIFISATCGWTMWMVTNFNWSFPTHELRKHIKSLFSPHGTVTKSCSEQFMHIWCSAYGSEAECHANALAIRKLQISCNIHMK
jgi:hypothetical protein